MNQVQTLSSKVSSSWGLSPQMAAEAEKLIRDAAEHSDASALSETVEKITSSPRRLSFPLSYLRKCLSGLPPRQEAPAAAARPPFKVSTDEDGVLYCPEPTPGDAIQEKIHETVSRINHERFFKAMAEFYNKPSGAPLWKKPGWSKNLSEFDRRYFEGIYGRKLELYDKHTWMSLKKEADASKTTIHALCRKYGIKYEALIY